MTTEKELEAIHRYWQAANYLAAAQLYLKDNILLKKPLLPEHIKPRLLGHWGTCPGLNLIYVHLNRLIRKTGASIMLIAGPGHGAPAIYANTYLEGSYSAVYPAISRDEAGMAKMVHQFSTPGGVASHVNAVTPGALHEGGELGYCLAHATGAVFDNPDLIAACIIGDGEAETGPLEGSWKLTRFLNPARDGIVLPILHLNGYKISSPALMARMDDPDLVKLFEARGYTVRIVEGKDPMQVHRVFARILDEAYAQIIALKQNALKKENGPLMAYPLIILRTPKGWTGPAAWDGTKIEGSFHAHQVPLEDVRTDGGQRLLLEQWLRSYHPETLFTGRGTLAGPLAALIPPGKKKIGMSPYANGGSRSRELILPDKIAYAVTITAPGKERAQATKELGSYIRDVFRLNRAQQNFRLFCPDEALSNKLEAVFEATGRFYLGSRQDADEYLSGKGRVMEVLSEHLCQEWMEGYTLTGRHGLFVCYEAFITLIDSMFNQYAKWLKQCREVPWRKPLPSFNYLLTSHTWRQDHNGYSHQGPGFIETVINKKSDIVRIYLPPDANCLLCTMEHCFRSKDKINLVIAGKQSALQWLSLKEAAEHCRVGISVWKWAGSAAKEQPDIVLACAGDVPTTETVAAAWLLKKHLPRFKVRVVNVTDLMALSPAGYHPHGLPEALFSSLFTDDRPVIFAFHGYRRIIHDLIHGRSHPTRFHVRGYNEEGTTTTPFDMTVLNGISRYQLAMDALTKAGAGGDAGYVIRLFEEKLKQHHLYIRQHLDDLPEIKEWQWS
ncbi:phosphoketolase family protein [Niabella aurantiaca]|uniref:phosphoketolase family protein n=1 Tax=Niabella aurantiaca TaxID=379900 RepID=UPI00036FC411|nr:phosphoketolase family protein [Niabella aurantiaca]